MKILLIFVLLAGFILVPGCKKAAEVDVTPSGLYVNIDLATDGSGLVTFEAHAEHAARFSFNFGEGLDEPFNSTDGMATHTYISPGLYHVNVTAYSAGNLHTSFTVDLNADVNEPAFPTTGYTTPTSYDDMTLVWQDEFSGTALNETNWNFELGPFNEELQYYKKENTSLNDGYLIIRAKVEKMEGKIYTSSRITTQFKRTFNYGRVDIRALVPKTQALFPALWMMGSNFVSDGWPKCGEIDIMETIGGGGRDSVCYGTAHWDNAGSHASYGGHRGLYDGHVLGDEFHVYSIIWTPTEIKWYLDDVQYHVIDITPAELSELKGSFFFIFNVAVGGEWPGAPDETTVLPQRMIVDYIRVFQ